MSRGAKCAKPEAMGVSEEPLNEPLNEREVKMATSLLARAVKFGQQRLILDGFIHQPGGLKPLAVIADAVMSEMELSGKRDREEARDEAERISAGYEESEWDQLSYAGASPKGYMGTVRGSYAAGGSTIPPPMPDAESHPFENLKIPLPPGVSTIHEWGRTVCQLEKYKEKKLTHAQMVSQSDFDPAIYNYLCWIKNRYGIEDSGCFPPKISPGIDLAAYLERSKFQQKGKETFKRVLR